MYVGVVFGKKTEEVASNCHLCKYAGGKWRVNGSAHMGNY